MLEFHPGSLLVKYRNFLSFCEIITPFKLREKNLLFVETRHTFLISEMGLMDALVDIFNCV